jgi:hypothetical protein
LVATALRAELAGFKDTLVENSERLSHAQEHPGGFLVPDLARAVRIWPHMIPKLGLFDQATIQRVTDAYLAVEQHGERLLLLGGRLVDPERAAVGSWKRQMERRATTDYNRLLISLSADKAPDVIQINSAVSKAIERDRPAGYLPADQTEPIRATNFYTAQRRVNPPGKRPSRSSVADVFWQTGRKKSEIPQRKTTNRPDA